MAMSFVQNKRRYSRFRNVTLIVCALAASAASMSCDKSSQNATTQASDTARSATQPTQAIASGGKPQPQVPPAPAKAVLPVLDDSYNGANGITIPEDDAKAPAGHTSAETLAGRTLTVALRGTEIGALFEFSGKYTFSDEGGPARGTTSLMPVRIKTSKSDDQWLAIRKYGLMDRCLAVVDDSGNIYLIQFDGSLNGTVTVIWVK